MKFRLLDLLKDPAGGGSFCVEVFASEEVERDVHFDKVQCRDWCFKSNTSPSSISPEECRRCYRHEIVDGVLIGKESGARFPVIGGIPRILPEEILRDVFARHGDFVAKYRGQLGGAVGLVYDVEPEKRETVKNFGYQWTTFVDNFDYFKEIFLSFTRPFLDEADFAGKLMLEIGCGSGRPAVTACRLGAEVVGMDISDAVETVYRKSREEPLLHVVQADAYAPPFQPKFDAVYSVGVLQHIPSTEKALQGMFGVMSERSPLVLWIYGKREWWYRPIEWLRRVTSRMPLRLLHVLAMVLALWSEVFLLIPYRLLSRIPGFRRLAEKIPGRIYARFPFRENVVGWFDRLGAPVTYYYEKQQIVDLMKSVGFVDIEIVARTQASASWVLRARRTKPVAPVSTDERLASRTLAI